MRFAAYDENDDGFQFSRARSKKTQPKAPPAAEPTQERSKPAPTRRKRNSVSAPALVESDAPVKRRRSARLSEDKEQIAPAPEPKPRRTRKPAAAEPKVSGDQDDGVDFVGGVRTPGNELHVEKKREGGATKIALPFADTPIIRRNKEMRKGSSQGHRRSSAGMRGRRASSLIDSGASNGAVFHFTINSRTPNMLRRSKRLIGFMTQRYPTRKSRPEIFTSILNRLYRNPGE
jgi:kinetochore protein Mis13/DSN1